MATPRAVDAHPNMPNGRSRLDTTIVVSRDAEMVVEGAKMAEGGGITSTSSSLGSAFLRPMMVTRGMHDVVTAIKALTDGP